MFCLHDWLHPYGCWVMYLYAHGPLHASHWNSVCFINTWSVAILPPPFFAWLIKQDTYYLQTCISSNIYVICFCRKAAFRQISFHVAIRVITWRDVMGAAQKCFRGHHLFLNSSSHYLCWPQQIFLQFFVCKLMAHLYNFKNHYLLNIQYWQIFQNMIENAATAE